MSRFPMVLLLIVGVFVTVGGGDAARAQVPNEIILEVDAPPSMLGALDPRLTLDGVDVTDAVCGPLELKEGLSPFRVRRCVEPPAGTYAVDIAGVVPGARVGWVCSDFLVAGRVAPDDLVVGGGSDTSAHWSCLATVAMPGVRFVTVDTTPPPEFDLDTVIVDASGDLVPATCESDTVFGSERRWCTGYDLDTPLEATAAVTPAGYRTMVYCFPTIETVESFDDGVDSFVLTTDRPLYECEDPFAFPPLIVVFSTFVDERADLSWLDSVTISVAAPDGSDVSSACQRRPRFEPATPFVEFDCLGLDDGQHAIEFGGVIDGLRVEVDECAAVVVGPDPDSSVCTHHVVDAALVDYPPVDEPIDEPAEEPADEPADGPDPAAELPTTGSAASPITWAAGLLLLLGGVLLAVGRRRSALLDR